MVARDAWKDGRGEGGQGVKMMIRYRTPEVVDRRLRKALTMVLVVSCSCTKERARARGEWAAEMEIEIERSKDTDRSR